MHGKGEFDIMDLRMNIFNRELIGNFNFFLLIAAIVFFIALMTSYSLAIWALLFKLPKKYKKMPFLKMINKKFIVSLEENDKNNLIAVRKYLLVAIFLTVLRIVFGMLIKLGSYFKFLP